MTHFVTNPFTGSTYATYILPLASGTKSGPAETEPDLPVVRGAAEVNPGDAFRAWFARHEIVALAARYAR